jgi:hypothetical protein
MNTVRRNV